MFQAGECFFSFCACVTLGSKSVSRDTYSMVSFFMFEDIICMYLNIEAPAVCKTRQNMCI